jgi:DNA-binding response OmpR family regulator
MRVLIVEDDQRMAKVLKKGLEEEGCSVLIATAGREGYELALGHDLDAVVLDLMLPGMNGLEVAKRLREGGCQVPILMLTARDANRDIVAGLDCGADDYLTKPFSFEVLLARLRAVARRGSVPRPVRLKVSDLVLDPAAHEASRGGESIALTRTEFKLLQFLMRRAGRVVPRTTLIEAVWGFDTDIEDNTLDAFIRRLRAKIDTGGRPRLLHTVRGTGYSLKEGSES